MSYSSTEIDFNGIHVACLTGPNGAGKSSLLDAITWTLWEEGRARTDELIKLGQSEMACELEFFMEDELYRVYRSRTKGFKNSQGKSNLEFQIFNTKEKNWISLSKSSTRQTQDFIVKTLKMDYKTYVNSVYLRQGKADEFTLKGPSDRKQILSDILGLEVYDRLCEQAKMKLKEIDQSLSFEQNVILDLKTKIAKEDEFKTNLANITKELNQEEKEHKEIKMLLLTKEKEFNEKKEKEKQIKTLERSKENQGSLIQTLESQLENSKSKEEKYNELIRNKIQIQNNYKEYLNLKEEFNKSELDQKFYNELTHQKAELESKLKDTIKQTEQELAIYKSKVLERNDLKDGLKNKLKSETKFKNFLSKAEGEIKTFRTLQETLQKVETEGLELKHKKELLLLDIKKLQEKKKEIDLKIKTLASHEHKEPCPLCKSPIKDKEKVIESYKAEINSIEKEEKELKASIDSLEDLTLRKRKEYNELKEKINNYGKVICTLLPELSEIRDGKIDNEEIEKSKPHEAVAFLSSQLEVSKTEFQKIKEQLLTLENEVTGYNQEINALNDLLQSGTHVKEISKRLNELKKELSDIKYDPDKYDEIRKSLKEKEKIHLLYNSLTQAESEQKLLLNEIESLTNKLKSGKHELEELKSLISESKRQIEDIYTLEKEVQEIRQNESKIKLQIDDVKRKHIVCEQALLEIESSKKLVENKEAKIQTFVSDKKYYEILEKAFSKNGIQVAIIETIVPEIEKEANRILNKLTENQMHIALKTQREKVSTSGLKETLDVVIADNVGTRNYELYSGGEAFKIDFSLRLALSRLLANRAGARLQTLIIDEGFGSQDSAGKERLIEVIRSIQNEFELILVVTHLDELKESFPVQIQVIKEEEGSKVRLVA